jgi:hypothetical protein
VRIEGDDERLARQIVSTVLGVPVPRFDDGTANSQVDTLIRYPDREAALEVVADHDAAFKAQEAELYRRKNHVIEVSGLRESWTVLLSRDAKINEVKRALPALLLDLQDNPPRRSPWDIEPSELDRLGVTRAWADRQRCVRSRLPTSPALGRVRRHRAHRW